MRIGLAMTMAAVATMSAAMTTACGGGGGSGPGKLRYLLDDQYIIAVAPAEQAEVLAAKQEMTVAETERSKAEFDVKNVDTEAKIATWELERARLTRKIAEARRQAAQSGGINQQNIADAELRAAELGIRAAEARRDFAAGKRSWLKAWHRYTVYNVFAAEAKLHFAKAKLAKAKQNYPKGFRYENYEEQARTRADGAKRARQSADDALRRAEEARRAWAAREREYLNATGGKGTGESDVSLVPTTPVTPAVAPPSTHPDATMTPDPELKGM